MTHSSQLADSLQFADHLDNTPMAVIEWDSRLNVLFWSSQAEKIFGWTANEVVGRHLSQFPLIYPDDFPVVNDIAGELQSGMLERYSGRYRSKTKDGKCLHCQWYSSVSKNEKGQVQSILSFVEDVTTEVEKEQSLEKLHERFFLIANATNDGIWEWDVEHDTVWVNDSYCRTFGYDPRQYSDYYEEWLRRIHPEDKETFLQSILTARQRGETNWSGEFRFMLADGRYGFILQRTFFVYDPEGKSRKVLGIALNITPQKEAEQKLKENEQQLKLIYNTVGDLLFLLDVDGEGQYRFAHVNNAFLQVTGLTEDQVNGRWVQEVIPEPSLSLVLSKYQQAINTGASVQWEETTTYPAGEKTGIVTVTPVLDISGRCVRLVGSVHDITERKQAEQALAKSVDEIRSLAGHIQIVREEERSTLAREIHDELGQLLTGLKMDLSWLKRVEMLTPLQVKSRVQTVLQILDQSINTVRNISAELRPSLLDDLGLAEALQWQAEVFTRRYKIPVLFVGSLPEVKPDRSTMTAFFRIYQEALTNVARHAQATEVRVSMAVVGNDLLLSITDNGIGFDTFHMEAKKTWGLLGMRERMLLLNGTFSVASTKQGTTIYISAPLNN